LNKLDFADNNLLESLPRSGKLAYTTPSIYEAFSVDREGFEKKDVFDSWNEVTAKGTNSTIFEL
jgi:hypothetical protein